MSNVIINDEYLSAIGDAIRIKSGTEDLIKPKDMANSILAITSGDMPEEAFNITGNCSYRFANDGWNWFIDEYGYSIKTKDITSASYMFSSASQLQKIPFDINMKHTTSYDLSSMFGTCSKIEEIPNVNNAYPNGMSNFFYQCQNLRYLPEDFGSNWNWERIQTYDYATAHQIFAYCYSLRGVPEYFLSQLYGRYSSSYGNPYGSMFYYCYNIDEIKNLPVSPGTLSSNVFTNTFSYCGNLKSLTFMTNEDGTPKTANWKSQTIDLSKGVGYCVLSYSSYKRDYRCYNSGRIIDKAIYNQETYMALKDDPEAFVSGYSSENPEQFSKYNHDSAVETINSLPDTSAYGTNTIKFTGAAGASTDGGAINTLTEQEIAVATAKGWTVSLV